MVAHRASKVASLVAQLYFLVVYCVYLPGSWREATPHLIIASVNIIENKATLL